VLGRFEPSSVGRTPEALGTKAHTLRVLASLRDAPFVVEPFITFAVREWKANEEAVLQQVRLAELGPVVVVRSSAAREDVAPELPPGTFSSVLGIHAKDTSALRSAIECVVASYERHPLSRLADDVNEVVVQSQLQSVRLSGVASTENAAGLYVKVYFDDTSGRTDTVTRGAPCKRVDIWRDAPQLPLPWSVLRTAISALESLFGDRLLIEFAFSPEDVLHVFQLRRSGDVTMAALPEFLRASAARIVQGVAHDLHKEPGPWSDMADWNPAEMLGERPTLLASSLYQFLVTDEAWLRGRASLGYRNVVPARLVELFAGKPYVNLRKSFLSFTPAKLRQSLAEKYVDDRLLALQAQPYLHDKVELELLSTVADICSPPRTRELLKRGFSSSEIDEIEAELRHLTAGILDNWRSRADQDRLAVRKLKEWRAATAVAVGAPHSPAKLLLFIDSALRNCRDQGVVPFSRQARQAFIASSCPRACK
jgi:glutamine kinase